MALSSWSWFKATSKQEPQRAQSRVPSSSRRILTELRWCSAREQTRDRGGLVRAGLLARPAPLDQGRDVGCQPVLNGLPQGLSGHGGRVTPPPPSREGAVLVGEAVRRYDWPLQEAMADWAGADRHEFLWTQPELRQCSCTCKACRKPTVTQTLRNEQYERSPRKSGKVYEVMAREVLDCPNPQLCFQSE